MPDTRIYSPECLTISFGAGCELSCSYCYARAEGKKLPERTLSDKDYISCVDSAAAIVAKSCIEKGIPFNFGVQGAGEPLRDFDLLVNTWNIVNKRCNNSGLQMQSFITTNGQQSQERYQWLATHFSRICVSVDGPEELHNIQRTSSEPIKDFNRLKRTLNILRSHGSTSVCRSTITRHNADMQKEMVEYLHDELGFTHFQFEPVYALNGQSDLYPEPEVFVENFLAARKEAIRRKCILTYSGMRTRETHGSYCTITKNVLFLTPSGFASACPFIEDNLDSYGFTIGEYDSINNEFMINRERIQLLQDAAACIPDECAECEIAHSCVKGCPDRCILRPLAKLKPSSNSLRCHINRLLFKRDSTIQHTHARNELYVDA